MKTFFIKVLVIGCLHCAIGVLLYRGMVLSHIPMLQSELLVFDIPFLVALIAYGAAFWTSGFIKEKPVLRMVALLAVSLVVTFLSFWLFMIVSFNRYGT